MDRYEIIFSGAGGQGMILAGIILAQAIVEFTDKNAVQTQSYGPEARGGASRAEVIVSSGKIDYPKVTKPDLLLALTQESYNKYNRRLKEYGTLIVDDRIHIAPRGGLTYAVPILRLAREDLKKEIVANMVSLGLICRLTELVSIEILEEVALRRVPSGTEDINREAIRLGFDLASNLHEYKIIIKEENEA